MCRQSQAGSSAATGPRGCRVGRRFLWGKAASVDHPLVTLFDGLFYGLLYPKMAIWLGTMIIIGIGYHIFKEIHNKLGRGWFSRRFLMNMKIANVLGWLFVGKSPTQYHGSSWCFLSITHLDVYNIYTHIKWHFCEYQPFSPILGMKSTDILWYQSAWGQNTWAESWKMKGTSSNKKYPYHLRYELGNFALYLHLGGFLKWGVPQ
jgi:hypothetical protein